MKTASLLTALLLAAAPKPAETHRAYRPPVRTLVPRVRRPALARTPIDRFILAALEAKGLSLNPEADRATLIRRVSFDLTGLPPTPAEIAAFLADTVPDAYERMVERYLASPHHGERWGKFWLDAVGYADSNGYFNADSDRPLAWRYRDYVVRSLNADKPYNRFVFEQLAGDELAGYEPKGDVTPQMAELLIATHFLRNAPDGTGESDGNPDEVRTDRLTVLEGNLQVLMNGLLGISIQCARCHSHKFEPISHEEYYRLQAILSPVYSPERWIKPKDRVVLIGTRKEREEYRRRNPGGKGEPPPPLVKLAVIVETDPKPLPHHLLRRGRHNAPGKVVQPGVPAALSTPGNTYRVESHPPGRTSSGRRSALARWVTSPENPLFARVMVNRLWQHHFGVGLVSTPDNLGRSGARPSHPELLDWLAVEFVRSGWSIKSMHRLMLHSAVYRQSSAARPEAVAMDSGNRLLWRYPLRRLDAEAVRDAVLAVSGELDRRLGGRYTPTRRLADGTVSVDDKHPGARRRSIYLQQRRTQVATLLELFDAPSMALNCSTRTTSTVPLQALTLLNSAFSVARAKSFADRLRREAGADPERRLALAFTLACGRAPSAAERAAALKFLAAQRRLYTAAKKDPEGAWADLCQMLLASNAFLYVE